MHTHPEPIRVAEVLEATTGGTRRHLLDLVRHMDRQYCAPTVIASAQRDPLFARDMEQLRREGIPALEIPMARNIQPWQDGRAFLRLYQALRAGRFDVVHTHSSKAGFLGRIAARLAGVPQCVHTPHVFPFLMDVPPFQKHFYTHLERFAARFTDAILCVWTGEKAAALQAGILDEQALHVVENGIAVEDILSPATIDRDALRRQFGLQSDDLVLGMIGRYCLQKGHRYLIEAAPAILASVPNAKFLLIGGGELQDDIVRRVRAAGLLGAFRIHPPINDIYPLYAALDLFVLPSLWEGLPYSLLEAMAHSRAIVASAVGGIPEVIHDEVNGRLVAARDVPALIEATIALLKSPPARIALGHAARTTLCARFQRHTMLARIQNIYRQIGRPT